MYKEDVSVKRKKKSGHKKSHKIYALVVILLGLAIVALAGFLLFYVQRIEVTGNEYTSSDEIVTMVKKDEGSFNSLYILWKYHYTEYEKPGSVEEMQVSLKAPWIVEIKVKEKPILGYAVGEKAYLYFDHSGEVVWESTTVLDGVMPVEGLDVGKAGTGSSLSKGRERLFKELAELSGELEKYELSPDRIVCDGRQIYIFFEKVCAALGTTVTTEKISQISPILEKLEGQQGTLHLEYFEDEKDVITFDRDEMPEVESEAAGKEPEEGEGENP